MPPTTIVYGPPGCGKSYNAPALKQRYGCTTIIEEWDGATALPKDALALTNAEPPFAAAASVVDFDSAMGGRPELR